MKVYGLEVTGYKPSNAGYKNLADFKEGDKVIVQFSKDYFVRRLAGKTLVCTLGHVSRFDLTFGVNPQNPDYAYGSSGYGWFVCNDRKDLNNYDARATIIKYLGSRQSGKI